jgi:repressor LexA
MNNLTARQSQVLEYIVKYLERYSYPPTVREIAKHLGTRWSTAAFDHLRALEKKGYIIREHGKARGIRVLPKTGLVFVVSDGDVE